MGHTDYVNVMKDGMGGYGGMGALVAGILGYVVGNNGLGNNNNRTADVAAINATTERGTSETLNALSNNALLGAIASAKDVTQNGVATTNLAMSQGFSRLDSSIAGIDREICESNCATQRLVETSSAAGIAATNANGNRLADLTNQSKWDLSNQINGLLSSLTLQNQALSSKVDMGFCTTNQNIEKSKCEIINAVKDDGAATRALINANTQQELRDRLALAQTALLEEKESHRATKTQVNIGSTVQSGIGNSQNAITDSVVNGVVAGLAPSFTGIVNVLANLNANLNALSNSSSNTNINTSIDYSALGRGIGESLKGFGFSTMPASK